MTPAGRSSELLSSNRIEIDDQNNTLTLFHVPQRNYGDLPAKNVPEKFLPSPEENFQSKKKGTLEINKNLSVIHEGLRNSSSFAGERTTERLTTGDKNLSGGLTNDLIKPRQVNSQSMSSENSYSATNNLKSFKSIIGSTQK